MDIGSMRCEVELNGKSVSFAVNLDAKNTVFPLEDSVSIGFKINNNRVDIFIKNNDNRTIVLNKVILELFSTTNYKELFCVVNPRKINDKISYVPLSKIKENKDLSSHLFKIFIDNENKNSMILGFLGSRFSQNSIVTAVKGKKASISVVYNFISQQIMPEEEAAFDSLYLKKGSNVFSLFNSFINSAAADLGIKENADGKPFKRKENVYSILYTYRVNSNTLRISNKPVHIKVNGKKMYAVDIRSEEGKKLIFTNANAVLSKASILNLDGVGEYIDIVESNKIFNVHYELNKLLTSIKTHFDGIRFYSDDYPMGLFGEKVIATGEEIFFEDKKSILKSMNSLSDENDINYDFFIKVLAQRIVSLDSIKLKTNNEKIKDLMSIVVKGYNANKTIDKELAGMIEDIDTEMSIVPYVERKNAFALLFTGKKNMYVAVFNFGSKPIKFYGDLSSYSNYKSLDGVAVEVYSNVNYIITDGRFYIRNLPAQDCCLLKKSNELKEAVS